MNLSYIFITSFLVGLSGAMMPGPLLTVTITESTRRGFKAGPFLILGHGLLEVVLVIALSLGLAAFLTRDTVTTVIAFVGGAFLLWMGWDMARAAYQNKVTLDGGGENNEGVLTGSLHPVWTGILVSLANPYWVIWWATIGLGYITMSLKLGTPGLLAFFSGHILADLAWYSFIAAGIVAGKQLLSPRVYRGIILVCGGFLVFLGGSFIYYGFN
ncbi:MAG: LysE family translocator [Clostridiales bacterium]|nr:LysE family translocator [Clostridiales bacterium]MCF8022821.1 LysE family translocator [Clostridiales bacterium]